MIGTTGLASEVTLSHGVALPLAPLVLGLEWHAVAALGRRRRPSKTTEDAGVDRVVGLVAIAASTAFALVAAAAFAAGSARAVLQPILSGVRTSGLDASVSLLLDSLSAGACAIASVVVFGAAIVLARQAPERRSFRAWIWIEAALLGAQISFLAEGLVPLTLGWTIASLVACAAATAPDGRDALLVATRGAVGLVALVAAFALLAGGIAGAFDERDDAAPARGALTTVRRGPGGTLTLAADPSGTSRTSGPSSPATLTMTVLPGALVYFDDARTASGVSPFVGTSVPKGARNARVHVGPASEDIVVPLGTPAASALELVSLRPAASLRSFALALAVVDGEGDAPVNRALASNRGPFGLDLPTTALCALLTAALAISFPPLPLRGPRPIAMSVYAATIAPIGPALAARLAYLFRLAPRGEVLVVAALCSAVLFAVAAQIGVPRRRGGLLRERIPAAVGALLVRHERWVIGSVIGAAGSIARAAAWLASQIDARVSSFGRSR